MASRSAQKASQLGKYRLLGELGRGGMATVYLAMASGPAGFHKLVVIKQIQADLADEPEFVAMFLDEARLAARLNHPNVVQTNEVGNVDDRYFIAMEYLEGQTLRRVMNRLGRGRAPVLSQGMQLRLIKEALEGLHYAHELTDFDGTPFGVVHRDVSPHNVFVTYSGQVKVVDFGIAKALNSSIETRTGVLKGKVSYMSPEQARGDGVDRRADIFSVGVILWEVATGMRMFRAVADVVVLKRLMEGNIPAAAAVADIDAGLVAIVDKALAPDPDDRFQTAVEMADALQKYLRDSGDTSTTREVGRLVAQHFSEDRERIRELVEQQLHVVKDEDTSSGMPLLDLVPVASQSGLNTPPSIRVTKTSAEPATATNLVVADERPEGRKSPRLLLGAAALLTIGALIAVIVLREPGAAGTQSGQSSEADGPTAAPAGHRLHIESRPAGAAVQCHGRKVGATPFDVVVQDGVEPCAYQLVLSGYKSYGVEQGAMSSDLTLVANLEPLPASAAVTATASAAAAPAAPKPRPVARPRPPPPPAAPPRPPPPPPPPSDIRMER